MNVTWSHSRQNHRCELFIFLNPWAVCSIRLIRVRRVHESSNCLFFGRETKHLLEIVLHLSKFSHDLHRVRLARYLLNLRVLVSLASAIDPAYVRSTYLWPHENVMFLSIQVSARPYTSVPMCRAYLLIADSELPLGLLVVLCKIIKSLDRLALQDGQSKLHVGLRVLMAGL